MTERERLIDMLAHVGDMRIMRCGLGECADYMLDNGVIVPPCKVGDYVRFKGLTSLWRVDAIHYYREGLPQISVTNGKITTTVTDDGMFEVLTREEAEKALDERSEKDSSGKDK